MSRPKGKSYNLHSTPYYIVRQQKRRKGWKLKAEYYPEPSPISSLTYLIIETAKLIYMIERI